MSENNWTPPDEATAEEHAAQAAQDGPPMATEGELPGTRHNPRASFSERAERALEAASNIAPSVLRQEPGAAGAMNAFAAVAQAFATLALTEQVYKIDVKLGTKLGGKA